MAIVIRNYTPQDKAAVIRLLRLNSPTYFAPSEEADLASYLASEVEDYFVAELDSEIVGAGGINYFPSEQTARLSWDIVAPSMQGKGIGQMLVTHRLKLLLSNPDVALVVVRTTQLVYAFYQKLGFELLKIERDYWAAGFDLYYMQRSNHKV